MHSISWSGGINYFRTHLEPWLLVKLDAIYSYEVLWILFLTYKMFLGAAPCYLCDLIRRPVSTTTARSGRPLRSLDRHDLLVPRSRTATAYSPASCLCFCLSFALEWPPYYNSYSDLIWKHCCFRAFPLDRKIGLLYCTFNSGYIIMSDLVQYNAIKCQQKLIAYTILTPWRFSFSKGVFALGAPLIRLYCERRFINPKIL